MWCSIFLKSCNVMIEIWEEKICDVCPDFPLCSLSRALKTSFRASNHHWFCSDDFGGFGQGLDGRGGRSKVKGRSPTLVQSKQMGKPLTKSLRLLKSKWQTTKLWCDCVCMLIYFMAFTAISLMLKNLMSADNIWASIMVFNYVPLLYPVKRRCSCFTQPHWVCFKV